MIKFHKIEQSSERNNELLNQAKVIAGLKNDAALSRALEVAPPVISKIRSGKLKIGATLVISIHEISGLSIAKITEILSEASVPTLKKAT